MNTRREEEVPVGIELDLLGEQTSKPAQGLETGGRRLEPIESKAEQVAISSTRSCA